MVTALEQMHGVITGGERKLYLVPRPGTLTMSDVDLMANTDFQGL